MSATLHAVHPGPRLLEVGLVALDAEVADAIAALLRPWPARARLRPPPHEEVPTDVVIVAVRTAVDISASDIAALRNRAAPWVVCAHRTDVGDASVVIAEGACGYLSPSSDHELIAALDRAARRQVSVGFAVGAQLLQRASAVHVSGVAERWGLAPRQAEILELLVGGLDNRQIATTTYLGAETVKSHLRALYRKLGARNRTEAIAIATGRR